ncbi:MULTISPECIES: FecR family protein [Butyricimonas]|uniref:FecR family protein n=1 Tax=Butyricimonas TaxID=574697 RepID=UPI0007FB3D9F|nr:MULTISPECIES: FecR family protein [Butyricimonas]
MMKNNKIYRTIPELLAKAIAGTLDEEESARLRAWREENEVNERLYEEVVRAEYIERKCREATRVNIVEGYMGVLRKRKRHARVQRVRRVSAVAAGILIPLLAIMIWFGQKEEIPSVQVAEVIRHGEVKAELIFSDGTTKFLEAKVKDSLLLQQGANIVIRNEGLSYVGDTSTAEVQYHTLRVPRGGEYSITLSDGTVVYLNSESELRYPVKFAGEDRRVYLSGEAYFDVTVDKEHPFIVDLKTSAVKVLGTGFDVRAYKDENEILTTLVSGSVVFSAGKESVVLKPGEQAVLDQSGELETREVDTYLYTAWKEGVFAFKQQRLEEIMKIVSRWYNVNIFWENASQKEVVFTGKMRRYDDFSKIVEMLEMTGNTEFEIKGNNIFIREK